MHRPRLSNRAIDRAGDFLRNVTSGGPLDPIKWADAIQVLGDFRRRWVEAPYPLTKVDMGLRSMVRTATRGTHQVSQRLKRAERIVDKLRRFEHMNLAQMQDIGGCRVVVPTLAALDQVRRRIHKRWKDQIADEDDYISKPRDSGYRSVHIVVERDGCLVEIQLRTMRQHRWAASVEFVEQRGGLWVRDTPGSDPFTDAFRDLGLVFALKDADEEVPAELQARLKHWLSAFDEA